MSYPGLSQGESDINRIVSVVTSILAGKLNAVTSVTLTHDATSTTLTDSRIGGGSYIGLSPTTDTAAASLRTVYVSAKAKGSATLTHDSTTETDRTYDVLIIG